MLLSASSGIYVNRVFACLACWCLQVLQWSQYNCPTDPETPCWGSEYERSPLSELVSGCCLDFAISYLCPTIWLPSLTCFEQSINWPTNSTFHDLHNMHNTDIYLSSFEVIIPHIGNICNKYINLPDSPDYAKY